MKRVSLPDQDLESLLGDYDENLRHIESTFGVTASARGGEFTIEGTEEAERQVAGLLQQLGGLLREGHVFRKGDVISAARLVQRNPLLSLRDYFVKDRVRTTQSRSVYPKSPNQARYIEAIRQHEMVFGIGPAGTGKTFLAMAMAVEFLAEGKIERLILARPAVEAGEKLGFLPGDLAEKVNPYLRPLYDALHDMVDFDRARKLVERGTIEVAPLAFMRGRTLNDSFVILDEAQNTTSEQMKMFLTRLGYGSKAVVTGDITQIDLPAGRTSGLKEAMVILRDVPGIRFTTFTERDVVRHPLVQGIIRAYERAER
jgi:phosphate starvation-inducible protein PhoH and related proteins